MATTGAPASFCPSRSPLQVQPGGKSCVLFDTQRPGSSGDSPTWGMFLRPVLDRLTLLFHQQTQPSSLLKFFDQDCRPEGTNHWVLNFNSVLSMGVEATFSRVLKAPNPAPSGVPGTASPHSLSRARTWVPAIRPSGGALCVLTPKEAQPSEWLRGADRGADLQARRSVRVAPPCEAAPATLLTPGVYFYF